MHNAKPRCPDCTSAPEPIARRKFLQQTGAAVAAAGTGLWWVPRGLAAPSARSTAETSVKALYEQLTSAQRRRVCFDWDHQDPKRGLLRTFVSANWHITDPTIDSDFFTKEQRGLIQDIFRGLFAPEWHPRFVRQLKDDTEGRPWGAAQNIAIFGDPAKGPFEFVMTGRHMTVRADGNSEAKVAFGGPIFHGHAASSFNEEVHHPGNIFWHQAELANQVYGMLDGKHRRAALLEKLPDESAVAFQKSKGDFPGLQVSELAADQRSAMEKVLGGLLEPYRKEDRDEVFACLKKQGGLDRCNLAFYKEGDLGNDGEWDNWRLEGPSLVWYFRGFPHVHIWINVAESPSVALNPKVTG